MTKKISFRIFGLKFCTPRIHRTFSKRDRDHIFQPSTLQAGVFSFSGLYFIPPPPFLSLFSSSRIHFISDQCLWASQHSSKAKPNQPPPPPPSPPHTTLIPFCCYDDDDSAKQQKKESRERKSCKLLSLFRTKTTMCNKTLFFLDSSKLLHLFLSFFFSETA